MCGIKCHQICAHYIIYQIFPINIFTTVLLMDFDDLYDFLMDVLKGSLKD